MLHQGYQEGMSKCGVWLAWHVWIIQTEFPGCIRDEHLGGVKQDHFYEALKDECQVRLAYKLEDECAATYAELLRAVRQIMRQSQARHPTHSVHSWTVGHCIHNFFPPCRLKGNHLVVLDRAAVVEVDEDWDLEMTLKRRTALTQKRQGHRIPVLVNQVRSTWSNLQRQSTCINRRNMGASDVGALTT